MIRPVVLTLALAGALLAWGGGHELDVAASASPAASTSDTQGTTTSASAAKRRTIKTVNSQFGKILADGRGQAVYIFDKETSSKPECYGACAKAWPPVLTKGRPVAGRGARSGLLGTTRRRDGKQQVTLDGKPLYYYVHDTPGQVLCHDVHEFGGLWLVVRRDGTPVP